MDNKDAIAQLTSLIGQKQNEMDALTAAKSILESGYQADQTANQAAIDTAVQEVKDKISGALN